MSKVHKLRRGRMHTIELRIATPRPQGLTCYAEWEHHDQGYVLKSQELPPPSFAQDELYLTVSVPPDAPAGWYQGRRLVMRVGNQTSELDLNRYSMPEVEVEDDFPGPIEWPEIVE